MQPYVLLPGNKWEFTSSVAEAKVIPIFYLDYINWQESDGEIYKEHSDDAIFLVWYFESHLYSVSSVDFRIKTKRNIFSKMYKKVLYIHSDALDNHDPRYIYYDLFFNKEKLYLTDYQHDLCWDTQFTYTVPPCTFVLDSIEKIFSSNNKKFLIPNRIRTITLSEPNELKKKLKTFIINNVHSIYLSDPVGSEFLLPNCWNTLPPEEIAELEPIIRNKGWAPIDNKFYKTSYVTLCIENNIDTQGGHFLVTEKSLDPLIKGNFPLIYAAPFTISNLKKIYGFKFPEWIDYSYDEILDDDKRWNSYLNSIKKIDQYSIEELHNFYLNNTELLQHNRDVFYNRPYDIFYDKVKSSIDKLGW